MQGIEYACSVLINDRVICTLMIEGDVRVLASGTTGRHLAIIRFQLHTD